jgi:hypothetical protein
LTPEQHNKYLGWAHLAHGGLFLLFVVAMMTMMTVMFATMPGPPPGPPPAFIGIMWAFMLGFYGLMLIPNLVAGYALLKQKPWARVAAIVGAVTAAMSFPIGTAVCAYTFWFLFSEPGKTLYDKPRFALPPTSTQWTTSANYQEQEKQYAPPPTPPDWR